GEDRLADAERRERLHDVDMLADRKRRRRGLHVLRVLRRERADGVLHAVAELRQHVLIDVLRRLRDEEDADSLRTDQTRDLLDVLDERGGGVGEELMRFIEEEDQLR